MRKDAKGDLELEDTDIVGPDYEVLYNNSQRALAEMQDAYEKKLNDTDEYWKNVTEASAKEIEWLKSVINSILHIKEN